MADMNSRKRQFTVEYTSTAFEQDAGLAMKGSVVRALIELITNCDDAYSRSGTSGPISIEVHRFSGSDEPTRIAVRDTATGLDRAEMEKNFIQLGGDRSGFASGQNVRGLFSRGSKDTAWFGQTIFESVKNGGFTRLVLFADGTGEVESLAATPEKLLELGVPLGGNGLSATMVVRRENTRVPDLRELRDRLAAHVQLRGVTLRQEVTLTEFKNGKKYQKVPVVWDPPPAVTILDRHIDIPGFGCTAHLLIEKMEQRSEGPVAEESVHGLEIHGSHAVYENSDFAQSGAGMALIRGRVMCSKIDELLRSYDPRGSSDQTNPIRLVTRSRDGLEPTHPFTQALSTAVVEYLKPILDQLEPKAEEAGGENLKRDLNRLGRLLAEEMRSDLDEDEDESGVGDQPTTSNPIVVIPPRISAQLNASRTLTVLVHKNSIAAEGLLAEVDSDCLSVVAQPVEMTAHARFDEIYVSHVRVEMKRVGIGILTIAAVNNPTVTASSRVTVHEFSDSEIPPVALEWKNPHMSVSVGKTRTIQLRAPIEMAASGELAVHVDLSGEAVRLDDREISLRITKNGWLAGKVRVSGVTQSDTACPIVARSDAHEANGDIKCSVSLPPGGVNIIPRIVDDFKGPFRGEIRRDDMALTLDMFARHRGLARYLGVKKRDGSYSREDEVETKAVIAEIMAAVATDHVIRRQAERDPSRFSSLDHTLFQRTKILDRYLRILLEGLRQGESN